MKFLLLALVAVASATPESESFYQGLYGNVYGLNYGLPATTTYGLPATTYGVPTTTSYGLSTAFGVPTTTYTAGLYGNYYNRFVKREAEAEADPYVPVPVVYGQQYKYPFYNYYTAQRTVAGEPVFKSGTFHTNLRNVVNGAKPQTYGTLGQVYQPVYTTAQHVIAKRGAESDADVYSPLVSALYPAAVRSAYYPTYSTYGAVRPAYNYGYNNYGYNFNTFPYVY